MNGNEDLCLFDDIEPGVYIAVETNPPQYPANLLDRHYVSDSDPTADSGNILVDNIIDKNGNWVRSMTTAITSLPVTITS